MLLFPTLIYCFFSIFVDSVIILYIESRQMFVINLLPQTIPASSPALFSVVKTCHYFIVYMQALLCKACTSMHAKASYKNHTPTFEVASVTITA